jgi:hypothetical protein
MILVAMERVLRAAFDLVELLGAPIAIVAPEGWLMAASPDARVAIGLKQGSPAHPDLRDLI